MISLSEPSTWTENLGYLPVPLNGPNDRHRFVLLNGTKGNFCLDVSTEDPDDARQIAWSADTDNFVSVSSAHVRVWRWDRQAVTTYPTKRVAENLDRFQTILESTRAPRERSVVAHFMRAYRSLRNAISKVDPRTDALSAFLALLARVEQECVAAKGTQANLNWDGAKDGQSVLEALPSQQVDFLIEELLRSRTVDGLTPILPIVLRHASGRLFQEAHYLVESSQQLSMFAPDPAVIRGKGSAIGAYFTPTPLVRAIVEQAFLRAPPPGAGVTVFDPACGSGEFLREALRYLIARKYRGAVSLVGWDVSPAARAMAQFALAYESRQFEGAVDVQIRTANSVTENWPTDVQYILTNPPFQAWEDMTGEQRDEVTRELGPLKQGRADLASVFVWRAANKLAEGGALGCVLPASILDAEYAKTLRQQLALLTAPVFLARLGSHLIFRDVVVDTGLFIAIRGEAQRAMPPLMLWADHQPDSADAAIRALRRITARRRSEPQPVYSEHFSVYSAEAWSAQEDEWAPRSYISYRLLREFASVPLVARLFDVQQGSRTGLNSAFLLERDEVSRLPKRERPFFRPAVVNESIVDGHLSDDVWVFFPYGQEVAVASEKDLQRKVPTYYSARLVPNRERLMQRAGEMSERWWELTRPRTWQYDRTPKIVSKYFGRRGAFALDRRGDFVVVQGFAWTPKPASGAGTDLHLAYAYVAILNSALVETLISGVSNNVAGGQWNLSARFVRRLPLPELESIPDVLVDALAQIGQQMSDRQVVDHEALDALARKVYLLAASDVGRSESDAERT